MKESILLHSLRPALNAFPPRLGQALCGGLPASPARLLARRLALLFAIILGICLMGSLCISSCSAPNTVLSSLPTVMKWHLHVIGHGLTEHPSESLNQVHSLCTCAAWLRLCTRGPAPSTGVGPGSLPWAAPPQVHLAMRVSSGLPLTCGCLSVSSGSALLLEGGALGMRCQRRVAQWQ